MDRYVDSALKSFANWYVKTPNWLGKERDCVNIFAHWFLAEDRQNNAAISDLCQIRIECAVPQPKGYPKPSATKDLVIWKDPLATTWSGDWKPVNIPRAIVEWKTKRSGNPREEFDAHDEKWLKAFTKEHPQTIGFLVSTHASRGNRICTWALVRDGAVGTAKVVDNKRSD